MGGPTGGALENCILNPPFDNCTVEMLDYAIFTASFHFGETVLHIKNRRGKSGFEEFLLHHIAACALYIGFTFSNLMGIGCLIAWLHDIADIPGMLAKMGDSTTYEKTTVFFFISTMISWFITRIIWLPYIIYYINLTGYPDHLSHFNIFIKLNVVYLSALLCLHVMWFGVFITMLKRFVMDGIAEDIQESTKKDVKQKKN